MDKKTKFKETLNSGKGLYDPAIDLIGNMANFSALLKERFGHHWVGFYRVIGDELVLGPFQGPPACTRIGYGKGVCGKSWEREESIVVENVHQFPGHISCSPLSNSEIVIPVKNQRKEVVAVLDIDSVNLGEFDETDRQFLEGFVEILHSPKNKPG